MTEKEKRINFIREIIDEDLKTGKNQNRVQTRFPPEPNGYLHIGHAKAICLNFDIARDYDAAKCNLRFDDTNPIKEEQVYIDSIIDDVKWLGFKWDNLCYASDYFQEMYDFAVDLIKKGKAYVCELSGDEIRNTRGTLTEPGKNSPYRDRLEEENREIFERMKNGEFANGSKVLRAKIDMAHSNLNMRDPVMYRILHVTHPRTGDNWCIYPMYDWAHGLEDSIERVTHSLCTLEFQDHRPLYDWFLVELETYRPQQVEFARLNLNYTVMSKRKLKQLVDENFVLGWDDPRMPTISGLRRRGFTPKSIRDFVERVGIAKRNSVSDIALLEHCLREDLNKCANRVMAVLDPLKVVITNYPEGQVEEIGAINNPEDDSAGTRKIYFSREIYIEQSDFIEDPPKNFYRLGLGREVRLKHAYYITCEDVIKDGNGKIVELHCSYDPATKGGWSDDKRKVRGTLHWISTNYANDVEIRIFDKLFTVENPDSGDDFRENINPNSMKIINGKIEQSLANVKIEEKFQFLRTGYFCLDKDSTPENMIFNRSVGLRDSWSKRQK